MHTPSTKNRLHGLTLETILTRLEAHYGWEKLAEKVPIACFTTNPSLSSSLKFLRRTPWARQKLERLYLHTRFPKAAPEQAPEQDSPDA